MSEKALQAQVAVPGFQQSRVSWKDNLQRSRPHSDPLH